MRVAGAALLIAGGVAAGRLLSLRERERLLFLLELEAFFRAARTGIVIERTPYPALLAAFRCSGRFAPFSREALRALKEGSDLEQALFGALSAAAAQWRLPAALAAQLAGALLGVGRGTAQEEAQRMERAAGATAAAVTELRGQQKGRTGFYENLFALAGAMAAILLF